MDPPPSFDPAKNPYKAKRAWPPDFATLSPRDQFRLERRYRRRAQLKWARPRLMAFTRLAQWTAGLSVLVYGVFFYEWDGKQEVFVGPRAWLRQNVDAVFGPRGAAAAGKGAGGEPERREN